MKVYIAMADDYDSWIGGVFVSNEAAEAWATADIREHAHRAWIIEEHDVQQGPDQQPTS